MRPQDHSLCERPGTRQRARARGRLSCTDGREFTFTRKHEHQKFVRAMRARRVLTGSVGHNFVLPQFGSCSLTVRNLEFMFNPSPCSSPSTDEAQSASRQLVTVFCRFRGPLHFVNPHHSQSWGGHSLRDSGTSRCPDLAVVATPPQSVPGVIAELGAKGPGCRRHHAALQRPQGAMLDARALTSSVFRAQLPRSDAAHFGSTQALHIATAHRRCRVHLAVGRARDRLLDWTTAHNIGFSHVISLADMADVDFAICSTCLCRREEPQHSPLHGGCDASCEVHVAARRARGQAVIVVKSVSS